MIPAAATVGELVDAATNQILGFPIASADRDQLIAYMSRDANPDEALSESARLDKLPGLVGLVMASPYFQWQ